MAGQKEVITKDLERYQLARLEGFKQENKRFKKGGIVFAGDSIMEFFPLKKYLGREKQLINRGISGTDSNWLLAHLDEQILALDPEKIFLLIGTNDLGLGYSVSEVSNRISQLIGQIRNNSLTVRIYLLSVLPVNEDNRYADKVKIRSNQLIKSLNDNLKVLPGAEFIDLFPHLVDEEGNLAASFTTDGLHLTPDGYAKLAELLHWDL